MMPVCHQICSFGSEVGMREYEGIFYFWKGFVTAGEQEKLVKSQVCECFKLYSCVIGIGNTVLPFTNEHNSEVVTL